MWSFLMPESIETDSLLTGEQSVLHESNLKVYQVYCQFLKDVPRIDVYIDGERYTDNPTLLFMRLWDSQRQNKCKAMRLVRCFTQSELVPWFIQGRNKWVKTETDHIIDGGRESIYMSTANQTVQIQKPFKILDFMNNDDGDVKFIVDFVILFDIQNETHSHSWTRPILMDQGDMKQAEWLYIEGASGPDWTL